MRTPRRKSKYRHIFRRYAGTGTDKKVVKHAAEVEAPKSLVPFKLVLNEEHARESLRLDGASDPANCPGALCGLHNADRFPHATCGYFDWFDTRLFVATKCSGKTNEPVKCRAYRHNRPDISKLVDGTRGGLKKLVKYLHEHGPQEITVWPAIYTGSGGVAKPYAERSEHSRTGTPRPRGWNLRQSRRRSWGDAA